MAKRESLYGKNLMPKESSLLVFFFFSGIPRNNILLLFSILDFQFVFHQYLLMCILMNESSSIMFWEPEVCDLYLYSG